MIRDELIALNSQFNKDIETYREILTISLKEHLLKNMEIYKEDIIESIRDIAEKGKKNIEIRLVPSHIYKYPFTRSSLDTCEVSLEYCIEDYIYERRFMGFYRKQVKFTNVDFKVLYQRIEDKALINDVAKVNDIMDQNPSIENQLRIFFSNLGLTFSRKEHPFFYTMNISF